MIIFPKFGKPGGGNLGNQMMQLMSMVGLSKKHDVEFMVPNWKYAQYFESPPKQYTETALTIPDEEVKERHYHYDYEFWDAHIPKAKDKYLGIFGWLQSKYYWIRHQDEVSKATQFTNEFFQSVYNKMPREIWEKEIIAISIRRGDYVGNKNYDLLPARYYIMALLEHFPDFKEHYNVLLFSDDFAYCHIHFDCIHPWYAEGLSDIEQLCLLSMCDNFILANSTFSIVGAMLAELHNPNVVGRKVIRPAYTFAGDLLMKCNDKDLYPENWIRFDHKPQKINLRDVTFTIPVLRDSFNREDNVKMCIETLQRDFDTNIILGEQGPRQEFKQYDGIVRYHYFEGMETFHRTKMLNDMALMASTNIVANWDADIVIPPLQVYMAVQQLKNREADIVYPYDGRFARVDRKKWFHQYMTYMDCGIYGPEQFPGTLPDDAKSVGGALLYTMEKFLQAGMENENMISYGPEDCERYDRFNLLGLRVSRIIGPLFHMDHTLTLHSSNRHEHYNANYDELNKIRNMSKEQLKAYVESWPWAKRYAPLYYESIFEEAVKSRDAVFKVLDEWSYLFEGETSIIDVGCGIGSWGYDLDKYGFKYRGIDFGVPLDKLVIDKSHYMDRDIRQYIPCKEKYDIALCLEVAEHLEPEFADVLVQSLSGMANVILFSAAIPLQGGINHHNEQWQSYWAEKFAKVGLYPHHIDIRNELWNDESVGVWYRQNMVLYTLDKHGDGYPLDVVHPQMFMNLMKHYKIV
jgi:2-polyprenyl-3-methyl-5-hydroxy-6-metoxy-1,4-benzoquinol methylase